MSINTSYNSFIYFGHNMVHFSAQGRCHIDRKLIVVMVVYAVRLTQPVFYENQNYLQAVTDSGRLKKV